MTPLKHTSGVCSLGVPSKSYGTLLSSIVMNKIPHDLRLIISREITEEEWDLDHVLKTMQSELEARERAGAAPQPPASKHQQRSPCSPGTAAALFANNSSPNCTYCRSPRPSSNGTTVTNIDARKDVLRKSGRCFICLRRNHISRACRSNARCYKCGGCHHISICSPQQEQPHPTGNGQGSPASPAQMNEDPTALYVSGASPILLQTARANVYKSGRPEKRVTVRILLDSGSQRTYVTSKVKESLGLTSDGQQTILEKTLDFTEKNTQTVDIVHLSVITEQGDAIQLTAYVVPFICEPLQRQSITQASAVHEHLHGINLADYSTGGQDVTVDILVGSDQYWNLVTGTIKRGEEGPTAMHTRLGWVLSGPTRGRIDESQHTNNLVTTHVLKSG